MRTDATPVSGQPAAAPAASAWSAARQLAGQARRRFPWLWLGGWAAVAMSFVLLAVGALDARTFNGVSVWTKPWKFHLSVGLHLLTLAWCAALLRDTPGRERAMRGLSAVAVACAVFELGYITWRAARGEASHFNTGDAVSGALYALMGLGAVLLTGCAGVLGVWIARARDFAHGPVLQRGLVIGLLMGWALGTLAGGYLSAQPGHWVGGTPSDLQGLPLVHWSRDGGDLRVPHFFGLHAMHVLPVAAWLAARLVAPASALCSVNALALAYAAFTVFTFAQAVSGRPFV